MKTNFANSYGEKEMVPLDESKLMALFGIFGLAEF